MERGTEAQWAVLEVKAETARLSKVDLPVVAAVEREQRRQRKMVVVELSIRLPGQTSTMLEVVAVAQIPRAVMEGRAAVVPVSMCINKWPRQMLALQTLVAVVAVAPVEHQVPVHPVVQAS